MHVFHFAQFEPAHCTVASLTKIQPVTKNGLP
jgi:hypothetical protein